MDPTKICARKISSVIVLAVKVLVVEILLSITAQLREQENSWCLQLDELRREESLDCDVAVLLNITPDHLDRYDGFEGYAAAKAQLFEMQSPRGAAVVTGEDLPSRAIAASAGKRIIRTAIGRSAGMSGVSLCSETQLHLLRRNEVTENVIFVGADSYGNQLRWPTLQGPHNAQNVVAAMAVAHGLIAYHDLDLPDPTLGLALETYPGLPHRMERIREKDGVAFVNDSKATNATATAPALAAFEAIRWICGGQAKADHLDECAPFFKNVREAYTIGEASELFARILAPHIKVAECGDLAHAVLRAAHDAQPGETILLSPACASFDQFKDYEARGDAFRTLVGAL